MYERAASLADMVGSTIILFFNRYVVFSGGIIAFSAVLQSSLWDRTTSRIFDWGTVKFSIRRIFYAFAVKTVGGYVHETDNSFEASFPTLPKNTDEMRLTSLYSDAIYLKRKTNKDCFSSCMGRLPWVLESNKGRQWFNTRNGWEWSVQPVLIVNLVQAAWERWRLLLQTLKTDSNITTTR